MAYSSEVVRRARARLGAMKADKESLQQQRLQSAYATLPRLKEIDLLLRKSMALAAQAVFAGGADAGEAMDKVRKANLALQNERAELIAENFPEGYLSEEPICDRCGGSGYIGAQMCACLTELCREEQRKQLSLLACGQADFGDFRLDYYPDRIDPKYGASPRRVMEKTYTYCQNYAKSFGADSGNLLFVGGTGLGKTMLSACIATEVTDKGYSVCYESAAHLFSKLEKNRFNPTEETQAAAAAFENCDLMIIDDLGTELPGNFVTAALYTLINDRLLAGKATIISTNLNDQEIAVRYSPQIASRVKGSFRQLTFVGEDIRLLKNR